MFQFVASLRRYEPVENKGPICDLRLSGRNEHNFKPTKTGKHRCKSGLQLVNCHSNLRECQSFFSFSISLSWKIKPCYKFLYLPSEVWFDPENSAEVQSLEKSLN